MNEKIIFANDNFIKKSKASIPFDDGSFQKGNSIFESIRFYKNNVVQIDNHLKRLFQGLTYFKFQIRYSRKELKQIINQLIIKNNLKSGIVNLIISDAFDVSNPLASKTRIYISLREK